uniref:JmjC domain-containing protein n=1 Tax=Strombidium inclinatum TaxID=197538 RepID=A0A7S3II51_9SPIT|mmetsp:Transcript_18551/g.28496  ORF Transcript_18551/g.28496 Transcript_18551/m.28496 type:complete len:336 (+) Transcript_18551:58-1065(+)|eukprot:CAMPEP_0170494864 /NCGR_PEP_ID=MMETSP0208-20121228/14881_1 /TAXON_ID=197538 /ORGANISM="Strombidium inclinatum, Strain S3" /LENGTH=335 /DNA_ID=CAMNT_0010770973 /DNA_START=59 /DNA_END=1066 /DNA_ORIENTATION=-
MANGKLVPKPSEYQELLFGFTDFLKYFIALYLFVFLPMMAVHQEIMVPGGVLNRWIRTNVYEQGNMLDYMAEYHETNPFHDNDISICDYRTLTEKEFFNEYVRKGRLCLFKDYAKIQTAYSKWRNESYMREVAGDEIIYAEKQLDNRFAYFTDGAKRVYMSFGDFLDAFKEENRTFHYYYSFSEPPGKLNEDIVLPPIMKNLFQIDKVTYWHGYGTLTRPHTDAMENMMCIYEGYKNFIVADPADRKWIYSGTEGYPDNYSPVEFVWPDYQKYPLFRNAKVRNIHIKAGDCLYVPAYYWHQVQSSPEVSIGVATFFKTYHQIVDLMQMGFQQQVV